MALRARGLGPARIRPAHRRQPARRCVTTTPRPIKLLKDILADPTTIMTHGSTEENAGNLSAKFIKRVVEKYEGTRLGRQELAAEILDDTPGALWSRACIDDPAVKPHEVPDLERVVVAIDPAVSTNEDSNETGIIAAGKAKGLDGECITTSSRTPPTSTAARMGREAIALYRAKSADRIVGEVNNGGNMVESTLRNVDKRSLPGRARLPRQVHPGRTDLGALRKKEVHHVGSFARLEDQMCAFTSDFDRKANGYSPDRMDALVWALTELILGRDRR
jgi:phage terminase large subunit-like protein